MSKPTAPGDSWRDPIWYRKYRIFKSDAFPFRGAEWTYVHDDFDGADDSRDNRCGYAASVEACKEEIDELEDEV